MATSRTRNRTTPSAPGQHTISYFGMAGTPVNESIALPHPTFSQTTYDRVINGFRGLVQQGQVFNNPFNSTQQWFSCSGDYVGEGWAGLLNGAPDPSKGYARHTWSGGAWFSTFPYAPVPSLDTEGMIQKARVKAAADVNRSDVMAHVTVGEWHKTKVLHKQVGSALLDTVKGFYSRNPGRATLRAFSNGWMTYRYAIMPSLYELEGAVKLLKRKTAERYTARGTGDLLSAQTALTHYVADSHGWMYTFEMVCTREVSTRAGILYETTEIGRFAGGLGLTRPVSSVYELTKFSWMLDWWRDVGAWLDAIQPNGASKTLCSWSGYRDRTVHSMRLVSMAQTGGTATDRLMNKTRTITGVSRTLITDVKIRDPWDGSLPWLPPKGSGLNSFRCLDVVSLVVQKLGLKRGGYVSGVRF